MPTTATAEIETEDVNVADQAVARKAMLAAVIDAKDDAEIDKALAGRHGLWRSTKEEIRSLNLASIPNRVAVLAAIGNALHKLGERPIIINCYGSCALPVAVDVDATTASDRSTGPAAKRWILTLLDADTDKWSLRSKYPARVIVLACSQKPMPADNIVASVACN
jgi:hypothetical protein